MMLLRSVASKVAWVGRTASMVFGLALVMALILGVATTALGKNGQSVILGKATNTATKVTAIIGKVTNGSALSVSNPATGGSALGLTVNAGQAPLTVNPEAGTAANLSADELDGKDSSELQGRVGGECAVGSSIRSIGAEGTVTCETDDGGGKAPDSELLDGKDSTDFYAAGSRVADSAHADQADEAGNADTVDGKHAADFYASGSTVANSERLDSMDSSDFAAANHQHPTQVVSFTGSAGAIAPSSTSWVFAGPTSTVAVSSSGQRLSGSAVAVLSTLGPVASNVDVGLCYQNTAGTSAVFNFASNQYTKTQIEDQLDTVAAAASVSGLSAGSYRVGFCVRNQGNVAINDNDFANGWVMVTNN